MTLIVTPAKQQYNAANGEYDNTAFLQKPDLVYSDTYLAKISASEALPAYVRIGSIFYKLTDDVIANLNLRGASGIDVGTKAVNTPYYFYLVYTDMVRGVFSLRGPTEGPVGFSEWTYLGCVLTDSSSNIRYFVYCNGVCMLGSGIDDLSQVQSTTATAQTLTPWPSTARNHWLRVAHGASTTGQDGRVSGNSLVTDSSSPISVRSQVAAVGTYNIASGWVPALSGNVIYVRTTAGANGSTIAKGMGFQENLGAYR